MADSHSTQSFLLLNNPAFNPSVDFPLRYFDLASVCKIGEARLGEKCTVIAGVAEIQQDSVFCHDNVTQIFATDETGCIILNLLNLVFYGDFKERQSIIFSGTIETYDDQKCINNPLLKPYVQGAYSEVMPVYPEDFRIKPEEIGNDETLLAIHGFSTKAKLAQARHELQLKQLLELQCENLEEELLKPYPARGSYSKNARLITRFDEGEEAQAIKDAKNPLVICPLAYVPADERNAKVYGYDRFSKVPESKTHPNISIETDDDCAGNSAGVKKRGTVLSDLLHKNVETAGTCSKAADLVVVEDADRISTVEIDYWMRRSQSAFLLVSNSKSNMQLNRLKFLCESHTQSEVLWHELRFRRDGDILGCRNPIFKRLSLVNLARMREQGTVLV